MTVFENVRDAMLGWNPRWDGHASFFQSLKQINVDPNLGHLIRQRIGQINQVQLISGGVAGPLEDLEAFNVWLLSHFCSRVVDSTAVSDDVLQEIANTKPADIASILNNHKAIFLPQTPQAFHFDSFNPETLQLLQAKIAQTLIERKILAATNPDSLNDLAAAVDDNNIRAAIFKDGAYGHLAAAQPSGAALLPDGWPAGIAKAQAKAMQALLKNPHFPPEKSAMIMKVAGTLVRNLEGLKFFAEANHPPFQIDFNKHMPSGWVLEAITSPEKAKAAIFLLNQFKPRHIPDLDKATILPLLAAVDNLEKVEILRILVGYEIHPTKITPDMLTKLAQIPGPNKKTVIHQLFSGSPTLTLDRKVELLTDFINFPPDQRYKEVAQGLSMMTDNDSRKLVAISNVVTGLKNKGKKVREKDLQDAIDHLYQVPLGDNLNQYTRVLERFCDLDENIRTAPVAIALERCAVDRGRTQYWVKIVELLASNNVLEKNGLGRDIVDALYTELGGDVECNLIFASTTLDDKGRWAALFKFFKEKIDFIAQCFGQIPDNKRTLDLINLLIAKNPIDHRTSTVDEKKKRYCQMIVGLVKKGDSAHFGRINDDDNFYNAIKECSDGEAVKIGEAMSVLLDDRDVKTRVLKDWTSIDSDKATATVAEALVRYKNEDAPAAVPTDPKTPFVPNDYDRRDIVVQLANAGLTTEAILSNEFIEILLKVPKADQKEVIKLLVGLDKEKATQAVRVFKEAEEPSSGLLKQIIEGQKIKFEVVPVDDAPQNRRVSEAMEERYKMEVLWQVPGQPDPERRAVTNPVKRSDAVAFGFKATLDDGLHTQIHESFVTQEKKTRKIEIKPQPTLKKEQFTQRTVEELAMYTKERNMSIELKEMDPKNEVKVKVFLQGVEKEIPFKALFFLAAAAQGMIIKEKGNEVFSPPKEGADDAEESVRDQKGNYLKSVGVDSWGLSSDQKEELRDTLFPVKSAPSTAPTPGI